MTIHGVRRLLFTSLVLAVSPFVTAAQSVQPLPGPDAYNPARDWSDDIPAHIAALEGSVTLEREGRIEPAEANVALLAGDRLRTTAGRVELLFADGSVLVLDEYSVLDLLSASLARLLDGRLRVSIARAGQAADYRVDTPSASALLRAAGEYRVTVTDGRDGDADVDLLVYRGSAELVNEFGRTIVRPGTHAVARRDLAPSLPYVVNSAASDDLDRWSERQRTARVGTVSTRYLPGELHYYGGAFDHYGHWTYVAPHGYVWYPRVATGWRPYSQGRWSFTAHFGWFWVGIDRWSWPTHHYGRWGLSPAGWYWIPDRRWAPAWVTWSSAPGYVSWCPLGYDGRPVVGVRYADPWVAWTIVPARVFVPNIWVTQHIVIYNTIAPAIRAQFVEVPVAPIVPAVATARRIEPIRAPTIQGRAVPRVDAVRAGDTLGPSRPGSPAAARVSGPPPGGAGQAGQAIARDTAQASGPSEPTAPRAVPNRSRVVADRSSAPAAPGVTVPQVEVPRATVPDSGARAVERRVPTVTTPPASGAGTTRSRFGGTEPPRAAAPPPFAARPGQGDGRPQTPGGDVPAVAWPSTPAPLYSRGVARARTIDAESPRPMPPVQAPSGGAARARTPAAEPPPSAPPVSSVSGGASSARTPSRIRPPSASSAPATPPSTLPAVPGRGGDSSPHVPPAGGAAAPRIASAGGDR